MTLATDNSITLRAAKNTASQTSTNTNSSSSASASYGATDWSGGASGAKGSGNSNVQDTSYSNTSVQAGNTASLSSGGDTNLKGAVVSARQVKAYIGANLNTS